MQTMNKVELTGNIANWFKDAYFLPDDCKIYQDENGITAVSPEGTDTIEAIDGSTNTGNKEG